jgi:hypothetical protein
LLLPFGKWLLPLAGSYFESLIFFIENPPLLFKTFYVPDLPIWGLTLMFSLLLLLGLHVAKN